MLRTLCVDWPEFEDLFNACKMIHLLWRSFLTTAGWVVCIFFRRWRLVTTSFWLSFWQEKRNSEWIYSYLKKKNCIRSNNGGFQTLHKRGSPKTNELTLIIAWLTVSTITTKSYSLVQSYCTPVGGFNNRMGVLEGKRCHLIWNEHLKFSGNSSTILTQQQIHFRKFNKPCRNICKA